MKNKMRAKTLVLGFVLFALGIILAEFYRFDSMILENAILVVGLSILFTSLYLLYNKPTFVLLLLGFCCSIVSLISVSMISTSHPQISMTIFRMFALSSIIFSVAGVFKMIRHLVMKSRQ